MTELQLNCEYKKNAKLEQWKEENILTVRTIQCEVVPVDAWDLNVVLFKKASGKRKRIFDGSASSQMQEIVRSFGRSHHCIFFRLSTSKRLVAVMYVLFTFYRRTVHLFACKLKTQSRSPALRNLIVLGSETGRLFL